MTKHIIFGRLGPADAFRPPRAVDTVATTLDLLDAAGSLRFGVDRALKHLAGWHLTPTAVGIDLITLAAHVHAADTRLNRVQASQDGWTREISIVVPVSDVAVWDRATAILERMLRFLTGDLWAVRFRPLPRSGRPPLSRQPRSRTRHPFTGVSLFSGGLDSLIGAVDELHAGGFPLFVSHGGEGGVSAPQGRLFRELAARQADDARPVRLRLAMTIPNNLVAGIGGENSTRGRSFLFFAAAAFAGSSFARPFDLRVPENGLISLNVPLDVTRLGSNSTRTTHPFYIHRWNELLATVGIRGRVVNPYWDRTKGEMVDGCANPAALEALAPLVAVLRAPVDEALVCGRPRPLRLLPPLHYPSRLAPADAVGRQGRNRVCTRRPHLRGPRYDQSEGTAGARLPIRDRPPSGEAGTGRDMGLQARPAAGGRRHRARPRRRLPTRHGGSRRGPRRRRGEAA